MVFGCVALLDRLCDGFHIDFLFRDLINSCDAQSWLIHFLRGLLFLIINSQPGVAAEVSGLDVGDPLMALLLGWFRRSLVHARVVFVGACSSDFISVGWIIERRPFHLSHAPQALGRSNDVSRFGSRSFWGESSISEIALIIFEGFGGLHSPPFERKSLPSLNRGTATNSSAGSHLG